MAKPSRLDISPGGGGGASSRGGGSYERKRSGNPPPNRGGGLKTTTGQRRVKVSDKDAAKIVELLKLGLSVRKIAKFLGYKNHISLTTYVNKRGLRNNPDVDLLSNLVKQL